MGIRLSSGRCEPARPKDDCVPFFKRTPRRALVVVGVKADDVGSLRIGMSGGYSLEVLPDNSLPGEHWRFFEPSKDAPHLVVKGSGIDLE